MSASDDWFSVQVALEGLLALGCPDIQRYEGEPIASSIALSGTPDLVAGALRGGHDADDFYIDVACPRAAHFYEPKARVKDGDFKKQLERSYVNTVEKKIKQYATARQTIMFGMVWGFSQVGATTEQQRMAAHEAGLVLAALVGLDRLTDPDARFAELQQMLSGGNDLLVRVAPLSLDLAFFVWFVKRTTGRFASFLAINGRIGMDAPKDHPVIRWLRHWADYAASEGRIAPPRAVGS